MPLLVHQHSLLALIVIAVDLSLAWAILCTFRVAKSELKNCFSLNSLLALTILTGLALFKSPYAASDLSVSDTIEYATAAHRLWFEGSYSLGLAGQSFPPRYPPFFSSFLVLPGYMIGGPELGNGILLVSALALAGVLAAFFIGACLGGGLAASFAATVLLLLPEFRNLAGTIWIDVPITALVLLAFLNYLLLKRSTAHLSLCLSSGLLIGMAGAMRTTSLIFLVPLLAQALRAPNRWARLALLGLPSLAVGALTLLYNQAVFGSALRSGYNYWVSIPYDFPSLTFSFEYIAANAELILSTASFVPIGAILFLAWNFKNRGPLPTNSNTALAIEWSELLKWTLMATLFLLAFFVPYFYCTRRFFLPVSALSAVLCVTLLANSIRFARAKSLTDSLILVAIALVLSARILVNKEYPSRAVAQALAQLPKDASIISGMNPAYLERLVLAGSARNFIPISREVEFASKVIAPHSVATGMEAPKSWKPHRTAAVLAAGAKDVYEWTVREHPENIEALLASGRRVFFDASFSTSQDLEFLEQHFKLTAIAEKLYSVGLQ